MAGTRFSRPEALLVATASAIVFTRVFAFSLVLPDFTGYARSQLLPGTPAEQGAILVGIAFGAYGLTMALAQLGNGILSDRFGRKRVLVLGTLLFVAGSAWAALAHGIVALILARLLQGLGGVSSAAMAAVGETVPEERRTTAMALVGIPAGVGFFLGFVLGPLLAPAVGGVPGLFWITAALGVVASLPILLRPLPAPLAGLTRPGDRKSLGLPVMALALGGFAINFAMMAVTFDFEPFLRSFGGSGDGVLVLVLVGAFVIMGLVSRVVDRTGLSWQPIAVTLVALAIAAPLFRLAGNVPTLAIAGILFFGSHALLSALLPSQVSRLAGRSGGLGHGIQLVVAYLGTFAGGALAGALSAWPGRTFAILAAIAAAAAALVVVGLRSLEPVPAAVPQS
ncbi:MAG: MFS transporter [Thermoplasmatota archaeon]